MSAQYRAPVPDDGLAPLDVYSAFHLPPPPDAPGTPLGDAFAALQTGARAGALGIASASAAEAWQNARTLLNWRVSSPRTSAGSSVLFAGASASALNRLIADTGTGTIRVSSATLAVDQPIEISRGDLAVDFGAAAIVSANPSPYMLRIENTGAVSITGGIFSAGNSAILVNNCAGVEIGNVQIAGLTGAGIVVTGSTRVILDGNRISAPALAGIMIHRGTTQSIVERNRVTGGAGYSNVSAGIVVTDREVDLSSDPRAIFGPDGYWVIVQPMLQRLHPPHDNLIAWNDASGGVSSGIYSDGGVRNVYFANQLRGNSKEGLCLDNGSAANVVAFNTIFENGRRWGDPDSVLALDGVLAGGRLPDGTAAEKVPGISLDNAAYNVVLSNQLAHNFGGGVKIVRTGYFNAIGLNTILDDNVGAGAAFHFFGIELGAAPGNSAELDFTPSRGNVVFSNTIRGSHYSGVFLDAGSDTNNLTYNAILDATAWAIESAAQMANISLNNLTNLPSRNIGSGLDPALITSGQPVDDPPQ